MDSRYLTPISRATLADEIVGRLTGYILETGLKPGDKLPPERDLMSRLSVGRSSLREALKILSAVGAVEVTGREGTFVGQGGSSILAKPLYWSLLLGERSMQEVIEARRMLEVDLSGLAAERATEGEIAAIADQLESMRLHQDDPDAYSGFDTGFHLAVAEASHNRVLFQVLSTIRHIVRAWIRKNILDVNGTPISFDEHIPILEAIQRRDVVAARQAMEEHLARAAARIVIGLDGELLHS